MAVRLGEELYYMAHHDNLASILEHGILSHAEIARTAMQRVDISDPAVQRRRAGMEPIFGRAIHDYVPLYLNPRNPMLYRRRAMQRELVILTVSLDAVEGRDTVLFTDGNAASNATLFSADEAVLDHSYPVLEAEYWSHWPDGTRRRCAEALVLQHVPAHFITSVACNNVWLARRLATQLGVRTVVDGGLFF